MSAERARGRGTGKLLLADDTRPSLPSFLSRLIIALGVEPVSKHDEKFGNPSSVETVSDTTAPSTTAPAAAAAAVASAAAGGARGGFSSAKGAAPSTTTIAGGARGGLAPAARGGGGANRAGGGRGGDHGPLYPIEGLSPYQNKFIQPLVCTVFSSAP